jgi:hypothetical protein
MARSSMFYHETILWYDSVCRITYMSLPWRSLCVCKRKLRDRWGFVAICTVETVNSPFSQFTYYHWSYPSKVVWINWAMEKLFTVHFSRIKAHLATGHNFLHSLKERVLQHMISPLAHDGKGSIDRVPVRQVLWVCMVSTVFFVNIKRLHSTHACRCRCFVMFAHPSHLLCYLLSIRWVKGKPGNFL